MSANVLNEQNLFIESDKLLSKDQRDIIYQIFEDDYKILKNDQKLYKFYK